MHIWMHYCSNTSRSPVHTCSVFKLRVHSSHHYPAVVVTERRVECLTRSCIIPVYQLCNGSSVQSRRKQGGGPKNKKGSLNKASQTIYRLAPEFGTSCWIYWFFFKFMNKRILNTKTYLIVITNNIMQLISWIMIKCSVHNDLIINNACI